MDCPVIPAYADFSNWSNWAIDPWRNRVVVAALIMITVDIGCKPLMVFYLFRVYFLRRIVKVEHLNDIHDFKRNWKDFSLIYFVIFISPLSIFAMSYFIFSMIAFTSGKRKLELFDNFNEFDIIFYTLSQVSVISFFMRWIYFVYFY